MGNGREALEDGQTLVSLLGRSVESGRALNKLLAEALGMEALNVEVMRAKVLKTEVLKAEAETLRR